MAKKEKIKTYVITGVDLEVHEVKGTKDLNEVFFQLSIQKPVECNSPGVQMYSDDGEQFKAFVMKGGKPVMLNTTIEFHLDE